MNKHLAIIFNRVSYRLLLVINNAVFNRIVIVFAISLSITMFFIIYSQSHGGYWMLALFGLSILTLYFTYSKTRWVAEFANFIATLMFIGLFFVAIVIVAFVLFLYR